MGEEVGDCDTATRWCRSPVATISIATTPPGLHGNEFYGAQLQVAPPSTERHLQCCRQQWLPSLLPLPMGRQSKFTPTGYHPTPVSLPLASLSYL